MRSIGMDRHTNWSCVGVCVCALIGPAVTVALKARAFSPGFDLMAAWFLSGSLEEAENVLTARIRELAVPET